MVLSEAARSLQRVRIARERNLGRVSPRHLIDYSKSRGAVIHVKVMLWMGRETVELEVKRVGGSTWVSRAEALAANKGNTPAAHPFR